MKKTVLLTIALTAALSTGCAQHGFAVYVAPQEVTAVTIGKRVPARGPTDVRLSVEYFHNGEKFAEPTFPFSSYAARAINDLEAFNVVTDNAAPELKLTLTSIVDNEVAMEQTLKSSVSAGFADATFRRDWQLQAELIGVTPQPLNAEKSEPYVVTTRSKNAPAGSTALGAREGYEALYDALIYPVMGRLIDQLR